MKISNLNRGGMLWTILIIVAILIALGYYGINLRSLVSTPIVHDNLVYAGEVSVNVWNNYLKVPSTYVWNLILKLLLK